MKSTVYRLLTTDAQLIELGITPASVFRGAANESPEMRPFLNIIWGPEARAFGNSGDQLVDVWVYDEPGDYGRIDDILKRVKVILTDAHDQTETDGSRLTSIAWSGSSGDLWDDVYGCLTKNASYTAAGGIGV